MTLQPVVHDVGEGVLAREIKIEGFRAARRAEDGAHTAAPYKAAAPNASAQWPLGILPAAHRCPCGHRRSSVGLLAFPPEIGAGPSPSAPWQAQGAVDFLVCRNTSLLSLCAMIR